MVRRGKRRGFTIVELVLTLALFAVLVTVAVPGFRDYILQNRVKTGAQELFTALLYARSEAIKRNDDVYIYPNGGGSGDWQDGWVITTDSTKGYGDCQTDQTDCLRMQQPLAGIAITTGAASVTYDGTGRAAATASFAVCDSDASVQVRRRQVSIDLTGRPAIDYDGDCSS